MTVSTEVNHNEYTGNGVTTIFPYAFRIFQASDLLVTTSDTNGTLRTLTLNTDYTVSGVGSYSGGTVILPAPLGNGWSISIERDLPVVQETDLRNQGRFFAETHEGAFDYLTMLIQQCFGWLRLALLKPNFLARFYDAKQNRIANLADPNSAQDAVNNRSMRNYVDSAIAGVIGGFGWFIQYGSGAVYRTFQDKMRDQISALDFTMNADGLNDDTANFSILETEYIGRVVNLCGKSFKVSAPPTLNTYIDGKFITTSLDTGLPVTLEMGSNSAIISSNIDTGEYEMRYYNGLSGDYQISGRTTRDLMAVIASQNCRSWRFPRTVNLGSIYSYSEGNVSGNYSARQCRATIPQSFNIGSEDCRVDQGFRGFNIGSIASHSTGQSTGSIGSRRSWATGLGSGNLFSVDAAAGAGHGAVLSPMINDTGAITAVTIVSPGTSYSSNGTVVFQDRTGVPNVNASATYTVDSSGAITSVTLTNSGAGYSANTDVSIQEAASYAVNIATTNGCAVYGEASANLASNNCSVKSTRSANIAATNSNTATNNNAVNIATDTCSASGLQSANIATNNSTVSGSQSAIVAGGGNIASASGSVVLAGNNSIADLQSVVVMGRRTKARALRTLVAGDAVSGSAATANIKFEVVMGSGAVNIASTLTQNVTFTDIAKMFENLTPEEIPVGALVTWEGRRVRLARKGDTAISVHSRTYAQLLGDSQFTWSGRYMRNEFGQIITEDIPDPDWQTKIPDPEWQEKIINPAHPEVIMEPVLDERNLETGLFLPHIISEPFIDNPEPQPMIDNPEPQQLITVNVENPDYDPSQFQIPRSERFDEWTPVALIGEVHTMVDATVAVDDFVKPGDVEGLGTKSETPTKLRCMEITVPFSLERGYAIALCLRD